MTAGDIARLVQGELLGDAAVNLVSGHSLEKAGPAHLAFWERKSGQSDLPETAAGCVIVDPDTRPAGRCVIRVRHPRLAFAGALRAMIPAPAKPAGIDPTARIAPSARIGEAVGVGPFAVVGAGAVIGADSILEGHVYVGDGAEIGHSCFLHAGAKVFGNASLGNRVTLHGGAVIGADGFGLVFDRDHYEKFPQVGGVEIGDDVEIGANACVDRGALDATRIGTGSKLDNLVHVGHNCQIGKHVVMAAQVGLSGGVIVEDYAVLGGQAGIGDRAKIGKGAQLGGQIGLLPGKRLAPGGSYWGTPARPLREHLAAQARVNRLPHLIEEVERLKARVEELEAS